MSRRGSSDTSGVIHFFRRGNDRRMCETRLRQDGPGYELVVTDGAEERVETFVELAKLLAREHELLQAWRAQGWRDDGAPRRSQRDWGGP